MELGLFLLYMGYVVLSVYIVTVVAPVQTSHVGWLLNVGGDPHYVLFGCLVCTIIASFVDFGIAVLCAIILVMTMFDVVQLSNKYVHSN
jgi:hypothetical protein